MNLAIEPRGVAVIHFPPETTLVEAAEQAVTAGVHLITDGRKVIQSPWIPPGWHRLGVSVKEASR